MLNYQRAKENRARRDFLRERCYLWGIILRGLGERYTGSVEVSGSIPLCSTIINIHPHSGWYFIFGQSPKQYWQRTRASFS